MQSIFLSYSFKNEKDPLTLAVQAIITAIGFRVIDGKILDNNHVGPGVTEKLKQCAGAVCLLTKEAHETGWVDAEFWQAVGAEMKICLLCDESLQLGNPYDGRLKFAFSNENPLKAIEQLAGTLGIWKQAAGSNTKALLLPSEIANEALEYNAKCEYRCMDYATAEESDWHEAKIFPYVAGVQANLPQVPANHDVMVRLTFPQKVVKSVYTKQMITLKLK